MQATTDTTMTIRHMCRTFGVTPRALRFYESKELIAPIRSGTRRLYTPRDGARLTLILRGKRFGFSLEAIRRMLDLGERTDASGHAKIYDLGRERLRQLEAERQDLDAAITDLRSHLDGSEESFAVYLGATGLATAA